MSFYNFGRKRHAGGRPKGTFKRDKLTHAMRISDELMELINIERRPNERLSDCVQRVFAERGRKIGELQKKVDALEGRLTQYSTSEANK